jgi:hypothetical protein
MTDFEKLGVFYLGRTYDVARGEPGSGLLLYDARDLVTHAVCVGMTGSGKTGLCISLLEEAALDGVPAIAIDPKGDLTNLLLTFPELRPDDFRPWINEGDARAKGLSADDFARQQAELWKSGLAAWGQDGARIARLRAGAEFAIYTPGSTAGIPVSILESFAAPPEAIRSDAELLAERVSTTATSLLALLGVEADPIQSREHILLATLLGTAWKAGRSLNLPDLIQQIQTPPVERVGVMSLETFYPAKERFELAMRVNSLLAAPGFAPWLSGVPLDPSQLLYTSDAKPRVAVMYIAHLSDAERMFFVSLLLNQVLGWIRTQSGTTSLRAILYMDEIFGFFPPVAEPPSKRPLLSLLKQARAFGLGVVLATQNPVDLDYKGLANAGTWFIGRLQTERDRARVLDGLDSAEAGKGKADRAAAEAVLGGLKSRVFLMHNVHEDAPVVFETRWAMSYLRGPLTREQIRQLTPEPPAAAPSVAAPAGGPGLRETAGALTAVAVSSTQQTRPVLPPGVPQHFLPVPPPQATDGSLTYVPMLYGAATVHFADEKKKLDLARSVTLLAPLREGAVAVDWTAAQPIAVQASALETEPAVPRARFADLPASAAKPGSYEAWAKEFSRWLYQNEAVTVLRSPSTGMLSTPDESERDFRIRLASALRERRDTEVARLREKYAAKVASLTERIRRAEQAKAREQQQASQQRLQTTVSTAATVLTALLGRRRMSASTLGRATTAARGAARAAKEAQDITRAQETVEALEAQKAALEAQVEAEAAVIGDSAAAQTETLEPVRLKPKRGQIAVTLVSLVWVPT